MIDLNLDIIFEIRFLVFWAVCVGGKKFINLCQTILCIALENLK